MSTLEDVEIFVGRLTSEQPNLRAEAQQALVEYGDIALLYIASALTATRNGSDEAITDAAILTVESIGSRRAKELLAFIARSPYAKALWPEATILRTRTALEKLGMVSEENKADLPDIAIRFLIFLLGSGDVAIRKLARQMLLQNNEKVHPEYYSEALENLELIKVSAGNPFNEKRILENRLYQDQHPRPEEVFNILRVIDSEGAILQVLTSTRPDRQTSARNCTPEIRSTALETARTMGIDTSDWQLYDRAALEQAEARLRERYDKVVAQTCFLCGKPIQESTYFKLGKVVFCSKECYDGAKNDSSLMM